MSDEKGPDDARPPVTTRRLLPMHRARLFALWTDPRHLAQWWGPTGWRVTRCEVDLKVGGAWHTRLLTGRGEERSIGGRYLEINPPERLVFTWELPGSSASDVAQLTIVTVTFEAIGEATQLVIEHRKLSSGQAVDMDVGWNSTLDCLARYLIELQNNPS